MECLNILCNPVGMLYLNLKFQVIFLGLKENFEELMRDYLVCIG